ncbi:hypothetical protein RI129_003796 [Pyrocoelia pectoralis]|uniref:Uncharacterized protein n=1 Tax=Pyrocoelia pectoralis TaxID=417401 RepID=A0AAN7VSK9_9COLE
MENKVPLNQAPPPYSPATAPIGFEQPHPQTLPYPYNGQPPNPIPQQCNIGPPPPLNAYNITPATQVTYVSSPLVSQQPTIAALNSTPRYYQPFRGVGFTNRRHAYIGFAIFGVVFVVFLIVFLTVFFTVFNKASHEFDEAKQRQDEFRRKYFPER